jgi:hypothetical protein
MNLLVKLSVPICFLTPIAGGAGTQEEPKAVEQPPVTTTEPWVITVDGPGWLAAASGHIGFRGVNPYVSVGTKQIIDHINAIAALGGEVRRGRFGARGTFSTWAVKPVLLRVQAWCQRWIWASRNSSANSLVPTESSRDPAVGWICWPGSIYLSGRPSRFTS